MDTKYITSQCIFMFLRSKCISSLSHIVYHVRYVLTNISFDCFHLSQILENQFIVPVTMYVRTYIQY